MPRLDHFHSPLLDRRHWEGHHTRWTTTMADSLNDRLPSEYFAEPQVSYGMRVEIDVGTFTERGLPEPPDGNGGGTAVQTQLWAPPTPIAVMPGTFPDEFEVRVYSSSAGPVLVAAIELVSPANKDREDTRHAFAAKCAAYLQRGIGLIVIDIVTSRHANLHDELITLLRYDPTFAFPKPTPTYAMAYRPVHRAERNEIDLWREALAVGEPLPMLPLAVRGLASLPVDLEGTYMEACKRGRIG